MPTEVRRLITRAQRELQACIAIQEQIEDTRAHATRERLAKLAGGILTDRPISSIQEHSIGGSDVTENSRGTVRDQAFVSYAHEDRIWLERLQVMLKPLIRSGKLAVWDDTKIKPGAKWRDEIRSAVARAKVAVLLVSPQFLASDFIDNDELPPLLAAAEAEGLTVLWIPVEDSLYEETAIAEYQAVIPPDRPLVAMSDSERGQALVKAAKAIKEALK